MSDQPVGPRKPPEGEEVDELPSESGPAGGKKELTLEEQIAQMTDLDIEEEERDKKQKESSQSKK